MKALDAIIAEAVETFCKNARHIVDGKDFYFGRCENPKKLLEDVMLLESQLQEIDEMIQEFNELKSLGIFKTL